MTTGKVVPGDEPGDLVVPGVPPSARIAGLAESAYSSASSTAAPSARKGVVPDNLKEQNEIGELANG